MKPNQAFNAILLSVLALSLPAYGYESPGGSGDIKQNALPVSAL